MRKGQISMRVQTSSSVRKEYRSTPSSFHLSPLSFPHHVVQLAEPDAQRRAVFHSHRAQSGIGQLQLQVLAAQLTGVVLAQGRHEVPHRALMWCRMTTGHRQRRGKRKHE